MGELTIGTLFSGGGGVEAMLLEIGMRPAWGVEFDPKIAAVHEMNYPETRLCIAPVEEVDYARDVEPVDAVWASPSCKNASHANSKGGETEGDLSAAAAVCRCIEAVRPRYFFLENTTGYRKFVSFANICKTLTRLGYQFTVETVNAADMGVPQTRKRLILRAVYAPDEWFGYPVPFLPAKQPWVGWYEAIEDLIPTLPESKFADWQLKRLPAGIHDTCFVEGTSAGERPPTLRAPSEPAITLCNGGSGGRVHRAFLVEGKPANYSGETLQITQSGNPVPTVTASEEKHPKRAWLEQGKVVRMTSRALARFQSVPDWYRLPEGKGAEGLAGTVIGNMVPPLMAKTIIAATIGRR